MRVGVLLVLAALLSISLAGSCSSAGKPPDNRIEPLELTRVTRDVDLTTPLAKEKVTMVVENKGKKAASYVLYTVEDLLASRVAYISAEIQEKGSDGIPSFVTKEQRPLSQCSDAAVYRMAIPPLSAGASMTLQVEVVFYDAIKPFPSEITQNEKQLVIYHGNSYLHSPYASATQSSNFKLPSSKIESFSRVTPTNSAEDTLTYGPYSDVPAFSFSKINIHFENNGPFLAVAELERIIEVSHWGNIAVEEHVHITHSGAVLKGSFSRYDYQRNPNSGPSSVKGYTTLLPAAAQDIYYRDEIGNISTSNVRDEDDYVSLELKPRFPLFGGWQTRYYYGYNIPSYEYLYHNGNQYLLKMRLLDHVVDDQFIKKLTVKIILPEGAKNLDFRSPGYEVEEGSQELKLTYLDTVGRPVIVAHASNLVEQHVQDFSLYYSFQSVMLLQEPVLIVAALLLFFLCVIGIVRLDFSITEDAALLARQRAQVLIESIQQSHDRRAALVSRYRSIITSFKENKDSGTFKTSKKTLDDEYRKHTDTVTSKLKDLQAGDPDSAAKVQEVQKKMAEVKVLLDDCCLLADKVVKETIKKQQYLDQSKVAEGKIDKILEDVSVIIQGL